MRRQSHIECAEQIRRAVQINRALIALLAFELIDANDVVKERDADFDVVNVVAREFSVDNLARQSARRFLQSAAHQNFAVECAGDEFSIFIGKREQIRNVRARHFDRAVNCLAVKIHAHLQLISAFAVVKVEVFKLKIGAFQREVTVNICQGDAVQKNLVRLQLAVKNRKVGRAFDNALEHRVTFRAIIFGELGFKAFQSNIFALHDKIHDLRIFVDGAVQNHVDHRRSPSRKYSPVIPLNKTPR